MSVAATIPNQADYREAPIATAFAKLASLGNYVYGLVSTSPAKLVKVNKADLSDQSTFTFANDGDHNGASDLAVGVDLIFAAFSKNGSTTVTAVPTDLSGTNDVVLQEPIGTIVSLARHSNKLFILFANADNTLVLNRYPVLAVEGGADGNVTLDATVRSHGSGLVADNGYVYFIGWVSSAPTDLIVYKIDATSLAVTSAALATVGVSAPGPLFTAINGGTLYFATDDINNSIWAINTTTLTSQLITIPSGLSSGAHKNLEFDGTDVWNLRNNGVAIRIKPTLEVQGYTLNSSTDYLNNLIGDGAYLYGSINSSPAKVVRYGINSTTKNVIWNSAFSDVDVSLVATDPAGRTTAVVGSLILRQYSPAGTQIWSRTLTGIFTGLTGLFNGNPSLSTDTSGNILLTAHSQGNAPNMGGSNLTGGAFYPCVAKYDSSGNHIWSRNFIAPERPNGMVWSRGAITNSHPVVAGQFNQSIDFKDGFTLTGGLDGYFAKLHTDTGIPVLTKKIIGVDIFDVALDPSDNIIICGVIPPNSTVTFGGPTRTTTNVAIFVAKYDTSGNYVNDVVFPFISRGVTPAGAAKWLRVDASGNIFVLGVFRRCAYNFGGGQQNTDDFYSFGFLLSLDSSLAWRWDRNLGPVVVQNLVEAGFGIDSSGNVVVGLGYYFSWDYGGGNDNDEPVVDPIYIKYTNTGGFVWKRWFPQYNYPTYYGRDRVVSLSLDPNNRINSSIVFQGAIDIEGDVHSGSGSVLLQLRP